MHHMVVLFEGVDAINSSTAHAITRGIMLGKDSSKIPPIITGGYCTAEDVLNGGLELYASCRFLWRGSRELCGKVIYDPTCRAIKIYSSVWNHKEIQGKIRSIAPKQCSYLFDPSVIKFADIDLLKRNIKLDDQPRYSDQNHYSRLWHGARCPGEKAGTVGPIDELYIEVISDASDLRDTNAQVEKIVHIRIE